MVFAGRMGRPHRLSNVCSIDLEYGGSTGHKWRVHGSAPEQLPGSTASFFEEGALVQRVGPTLVTGPPHLPCFTDQAANF